MGCIGAKSTAAGSYPGVERATERSTLPSPYLAREGLYFPAPVPTHPTTDIQHPMSISDAVWFATVFSLHEEKQVTGTKSITTQP